MALLAIVINRTPVAETMAAAESDQPLGETLAAAMRYPGYLT